jgi:hypothetical protein
MRAPEGPNSTAPSYSLVKRMHEDEEFLFTVLGMAM